VGADGNGGAAAKALVVEDDDGLLGLVRRLLELDGLDVIGVPSGEEALEAARAERPTIAILDVSLPGISGYEVCRELRRAYGPQLPILFVSGARTESYDRVAGLLIGADDYLAKPFAPDELLASLTAREQEVLRLLADGLNQRDIADALVISPKTVGTHIERILEKLGVHSRVQAVALAYREGAVGAVP
jgi:DNA-binding NarL/FixJ family response regulator